ncbi:zf-HC2 domain-containing protein [Streptomyces sp. NPDC052535]|uniref:zf-HC2 domain-containing protein n=1 Tax=Streptomyces sp. NPDC052535 TaxID=3155531 RepID=UPI0034168681
MHPPAADCASIRDLLPEYALRLLDTEEAAPVRAHLDSCGACRAEHQELAEAVALLAPLRDALASLVTDGKTGPVFRARAACSLARQPRRARPWSPRSRPG